MRPIVRRTSLLGVGVVAASALLASSPVQAQAATRSCKALVSVYGALSDGRLTYTAIHPANGNRERTVVSTAKLGFVPKAMATVNYNTILVTQPDGDLYRIDVSTNTVKSGLNFVTHRIASGWTHDKLTFDGHGHLYGTSNGRLLQYTVTASKPWSGRISTGKEIGTGFGLKTLASSGDDRLYATTTSGGKLVEYTVSASGSWSRKDLVPSGWGGFDQLVSPHGGLIYGQTSSGGMYWYEHDGSTVKYHTGDPVDASGWTQTILSAQPNTCTGTGRGAAPRPNPEPASNTDGRTLTPRAAWVDQEVSRAFPDEFNCFTYDDNRGTGDHATGNAIDCPPGEIGSLPSPAEKASGDDLAAWARRYAGDLKIQYVIWRARIWNISRDSEGWRRHCGGVPAARCDNPTTYDDIKNTHYDHVHISVITP